MTPYTVANRQAAIPRILLMPPRTESKAHALRDLLQSTRKAVVFTGAGISTESGIPDFRSPTGIWSKATPIQYDEFVRFEDARREAWRRKFEIDKDLIGAQPNAGHRAVASLVERDIVQYVITQNIDGLHQRSGVADEQLVELHGNTTYARCLTCMKRHELEPIREAFLDEGKLPVCVDCGGIVKSATISFGQAMPEQQMQLAEKATLECDLFLAIGSSLVVYPAAGFPIMAKQNGAKLVIINRECTDLDNMADLVVNAEIGDTLRTATGAN
jgi:NAD-dependent deacetylase